MRALMLFTSLVATSTAVAAAPFAWDIPGAVSEVQVPARTSVSGVDVRMKAVASSWKPEALVRHVLQSFRRAGLYIPPPARQRRASSEVTLTALDVKRLVSYTLVLQPNADGTTTCILGEADLKKTAPPKDESAPPMFPGAEEPISARTEGARTVTYSAKARAEEVLAFYREALRKAGYQEEKEAEFVRGDERLQLLTRKLGGERVAVTLIQNRPPQEVPLVPAKK